MRNRERKGTGFLDAQGVEDFISTYMFSRGFTAADLTTVLDSASSSRGRRSKVNQDLIEAVQECCWWIYMRTDTPSTTIASAINRTHPTVIKAAAKVQGLIDINCFSNERLDLLATAHLRLESKLKRHNS